MSKLWLLGLFGIELFLYSLYSYSQVDPNLVLSSNPGYWQWQQEMWRLGFHQRIWSVFWYVGLIVSLFITYQVLLKEFSNQHFKMRELYIGILIAIMALFMAYPALSHDVFNYAMNAKMVWKYHADPHLTVALDFPQDPWLAFMHNVHTPAPYARGWTWLSVPLGFLAQDNIKLNLYLFRALMIGAIGVLMWVMRRFKGVSVESLAGLFLNPLFLIETIGNIHNDVVMMALEMAALWLGMRALAHKSTLQGLAAVTLFAASVSIKYASIMLIVGWLGQRWLSLGGSLTLAHFSLLTIPRSKQFLPWYLIWPLTFLPLTREVLIRKLLYWFSLSALLSYVPYLYWGEYHSLQDTQRLVLLWGLPLLAMLGDRLFTGKKAWL